MRLKDKFELWWDTERLSTAFNSFKAVAWEAYQAGHAASGRDELLAALESLLMAVETMKCPQNVDDVAMLVIRFAAPIEHSRAAIAKAKGES